MWRLHAVMDFLLLLSVLLFLLRPIFTIQNKGIKPYYENRGKLSSWSALKHQILRPKRSEPYRITECVFVASEDTFYYYKSEENSDQVCGVYLFGDPDEVIEISFEYLNAPCEMGALVTFFDGWELRGKLFPGVEDHEKPFRERHEEFCGMEKPKKVFITTQNAGMIHYRIPAKGKGFSFYVRFLKNPAPCNILVESKEDVYTLRNHGKANNCTLMAVFPARIEILNLDVGVLTSYRETGTVFKCGEKKMSDRLEIGGSEDLDSSRFVLFEDICGLDSSPGIGAITVGCEVSIVRLVSAGHFENSATFSVGQPEEVELLETSFTCSIGRGQRHKPWGCDACKNTPNVDEGWIYCCEEPKNR